LDFACWDRRTAALRPLFDSVGSHPNARARLGRSLRHCGAERRPPRRRDSVTLVWPSDRTTRTRRRGAPICSARGWTRSAGR